MDKEASRIMSAPQQEGQESDCSASVGERVWQEPKLTFIEPKLCSHGKLENVTGGFFGPISP